MESYIGKKIAATKFDFIIDADSGSIYFNEKGIVFTATFGVPKIKIDYYNIRDVFKKRALFGIISCICILTNNGEKHKFIVFKRTAVIEFLKSRIS